jgi:hypothetical protein
MGTSPFDAGAEPRGSAVAFVDDITMAKVVACAALDAANRAAAGGLTHDRAVAAFQDARAALARIVELHQADDRRKQNEDS